MGIPPWSHFTIIGRNRERARAGELSRRLHVALDDDVGYLGGRAERGRHGVRPGGQRLLADPVRENAGR